MPLTLWILNQVQDDEMTLSQYAAVLRR